jgi:hypothetical protein
MQSLVIRAGVLTALCVFVGGAAATEATIVRGMFGPRAIGGPVAPQPRTRFDNGIQRGPSGQILGLPRNQRFYYEGPERFYYEGPEAFLLRSTGAAVCHPRLAAGHPGQAAGRIATAGAARHAARSRAVPPRPTADGTARAARTPR